MTGDNITLEIVHDRMCAIDAEQTLQARDIASLRETSARTEAKVDTLVELAREDRAARHKIWLAALGLIGTGGGLSALINYLAGHS